MLNRAAVTLALLTLVAGAAPAADLSQQPQNLVQLVSAAPQILIAAAGATPGANGTFFRSDISIINLSDREQRVQLYWFPQEGQHGEPVYITIAARSGISSEDFVTNVLNQQGLGAILVSTVNASDQIDTTGALHVTSRIWTPQPNVTNGTTSQSFNTIPVNISAGNGAPAASIFGLRRDSRYRLNAGIVNMSSTFTETYQIRVVPATSGSSTDIYNVAVRPLSMVQVPLNSQSTPIGQVFIQKTSPGLGSWAAYGSSTDNVTGDSWSELAIPAAP